MESAVGALYGASSVIQGAFGFAKGMLHPTQPLRASLTHISSAPLPRAGHTLAVVKGRAYIFGGEGPDGHLADNAMHVVILPSSGVLEADYYAIKPRAGTSGGPVPAARKQHSAVVVGDDIFIFGGELDAAASAETEAEQPGTVWAFSTATAAWSRLVPSDPEAPAPSPRALHAAAAAEEPAPRQVNAPPANILPQQPPDPAKTVPEPPEPESWGTLFVAGGRALGNNSADEAEAEAAAAAKSQVLHDLWAFDVRSRTWISLAPPPGPARIGAALALSGSRLYLVGGATASPTMPVPRPVASLDVSGLWKFSAAGGRPSRTLSGEWETLSHPPATASDDKTAAASDEDAAGPEPRAGAALLPVTTGQGRGYALLVGGARPTAAASSSSSRLYSSILALQLPSPASTAAAAKDAVRGSARLDTHAGRWAEVRYRYVDASGDEVGAPAELVAAGEVGMGGRAGFAAAAGTEVDGASVVAWGGVDEGGRVRGDGWLITVDR
ncbi:uncharacterized protein K452DRAFT_221990 [Aplosporella prunicola CBS 121167]|uniref:Galactose oxidase n=1 Tax=Aplosporella prunicola CBS 121167 TaxID=1176127 RepID=A0A6A6BMV1_9PEZI|nr:uncharacterized protein K452DRAFT_221990 [Aplosporella prunicola CBS 121167]KAF2144998.1 hypothetical protein K452DRAFT_221990 [Aplosporella prunicola CBS 121167]